MNVEFYINLYHPMKEYIQIKDKYIFNPNKTTRYETIKPFQFYGKTNVIQFDNKENFNPYNILLLVKNV